MDRPDDADSDVQLIVGVKMTSRGFLEVLAQTPRDWRLEEGRIRRGPRHNPECPITAVAHALERGPTIPAVAIVPALRSLRLGSELVIEVVKASDDCESCDPLVRAQLMEACGLLVDEERPEMSVPASD